MFMNVFPNLDTRQEQNRARVPGFSFSHHPRTSNMHPTTTTADPELTTTLPHHHRDPFDRLLVAQAFAGGLTLLTADAQLASYAPMPVRVLR